MNTQSEIEQMQPGSECLAAQAAFSSYLDGAVSGVEMGRVADHLAGCAALLDGVWCVAGNADGPG